MKPFTRTALGVVMCGSILSACFLPLLGRISFARAVPGQGDLQRSHLSETLELGAVVEEVANNSEADHTGLRGGDILLSWVSARAAGPIESPFDLLRVEIEQAPLGAVTLEGLRGSEKRTWTLGPDAWGIRARPKFSDVFLPAYEEGQRLVKAGKLSEAKDRWKALLSDEQCPPWLAPWLLSRSADLLADARESDQAYRASLQAGQSAGIKPTIQAQILCGWADQFEKRSDWASAEKYYREALWKSREMSKNTLTVAAILNKLATVNRNRQDITQAERYYRQALVIEARVAPQSLPLGETLYGLGRLASLRDRLSEAEEDFRQALAIQERLVPRTLAEASTLIALGIVADQSGQANKAEDYYTRAKAIRERLIPGSPGVASVLNNLGYVALARGDLSQAKEYFLQALAIYKATLPSSLDAAKVINNLGALALNRGDLAEAELYHREALSIKEKLVPESSSLAASLNNLGIVAQRRGDIAAAQRLFGRALILREKLGPDTLDVAETLDNLGVLALDWNDLGRADHYFHRSLRIQRKIGPGGMKVAASLHNLANVALSRNDLAAAESYERRALEIEHRQAPASLEVAQSFNDLGTISRGRGDLTAAEEYQRRALEIQDKLAPESLEYAVSLTALGDIARDRKNLAQAENYYRHALAIRKGIAPGSIAHAESLAALGSVLGSKQQFDTAAQFYDEALRTFESQTARLGGTEGLRSEYRGKHSGYYRDYVETLLAQNQPDLAFQVLERFRARSLLEILAQARVDIRKGVEPQVLAQEKSLQQSLGAKSERRVFLLSMEHSEMELATVNGEIEEVLRKYHEVQAQIEASSPAYAALTQPKPLSAKEVQQELLDADSLLLEYVLGPQHSRLFVLSQTALETYELPPGATIKRQARRVYSLVTARNRSIPKETVRERQIRIAKADANYWPAALRLSNVILGPIAGKIEGKRLLIVSDGALQYLSFAALPVPGGPPTPKFVVPLIAAHEIVNLPSASVLAQLRRENNHREQGRRAVAVLADPVFDRDDERVADSGSQPTHQAVQGRRVAHFSPEPLLPMDRLVRAMEDLGSGERTGFHLDRLRFTRAEAESILSVTPRGSAKAALDFDANRETATSPELAEYRVVHFATHALIDGRHPELSGLVLSMVDREGKPQNGFLDLEDIYNLNLPVDLVVLSACETGLGEEINGEGLVGLTRGFMYAGASRVESSLWKVSDVATARLMARFYRGLELDGLRPAAALRAAQVFLWREKRWSSPYYWAAFHLQGEWN